MSERAPSILQQLRHDPRRALCWLLAGGPAVVTVVVWTSLTGAMGIGLSTCWRAALSARGIDVTSRRWDNPGLALVDLWGIGYRLIARAFWGLRLASPPEVEPVSDGTVCLMLLAHPPAGPTLLLASDLFSRVARRRCFTPFKKELPAFLRWPGEQLGLGVGLERGRGEDAVDTLERALESVPLSGTVVAIFPEGTRIRRRRLAEGHAWSGEAGRVLLWHHLPPRVRGSYALLCALRRRAREEGLRLEVRFGRYWLTRPGWAESLGTLFAMGARLHWVTEDVTEEALRAGTSRETFGDWLFERFEDADRRIPVSPFFHGERRGATYVG